MRYKSLLRGMLWLTGADLMELLGFDDSERFTEAYKGWLEEVLEGDGHARYAKWSESIAVGSISFVEEIKEKLGIRAIGRGVVKTEAGYELKELLSPYSRNFDGKVGVVRAENSYLGSFLMIIQ